MKRVSQQEAYMLHRRAYRETSFLIDVITPDFGRLSLIARGVRQSRSSPQGLLQPFVPILISWAGKGELMTLHDVEVNGETRRLSGDNLFAGFYLNELLMYLLQKWDPHPGIYAAYDCAIAGLQASVLDEKILRIFEKYLIEELGYGVLPKQPAAIASLIQSDKHYRFVPDQGFVVSDFFNDRSAAVFSGKSLLAIAQEDWENEEVLRDAKRLNRYILTPLLGSRPLFSRRLFTLPEEEKT